MHTDNRLLCDCDSGCEIACCGGGALVISQESRVKESPGKISGMWREYIR